MDEMAEEGRILQGFASLPPSLETGRNEVLGYSDKQTALLHKSLSDSRFNVHNKDMLSDVLSPDFPTIDQLLEASSPLVKFLVSPVTASDLQSPQPRISYSQQDSKKVTKSMMILEELVTSENTYFISLAMLKRFYIDPLVTSGRETCGTPIILFQIILEKLLLTHSRTKELFEQLEANQMVEFVQVINEVAITLHYYEEYCNIYDDVLKLIRSSNVLSLNKVWVQSLQQYLEATQPITLRMDLSFISLIQRPVSRITKYRLMVESLLKLVSQHDTAKIQSLTSLLEQIKTKLNILNGNCKKFKKTDKMSKIDEILNFAAIDNYDFGLSAEFFGNPLLIGVLTPVWIEDRFHRIDVKSKILAAVLFKSHLVVGNLTKAANSKGSIIFIVALSRCQIICDSKDSVGGLYSNYPYTIKLIFEIEFTQYEILLIFFTKKEFIVWRENLETAIEEVNGFYPLNFSNSYISVVSLTPPRMSPCNICLSDYDTYKKYREKCYFHQPLSVGIAIDFSSIDFEDLFLLTGYFNSLNSGVLGKPDVILNLKKADRLSVERMMHGIISSELPILFYKENTPSRHGTLRKSATWTSLKMHQLMQSQTTCPLSLPDEVPATATDSATAMESTTANSPTSSLSFNSAEILGALKNTHTPLVNNRPGLRNSIIYLFRSSSTISHQ